MTSSDDGGPAPDRSIRLVLFLAGNVLFGAGLFAHAFLYNFYLERLGHGAALMGGAAAALTAGGLAALAPAGVLVDRAGARTAYLLACMVAAAGLITGAFVERATTIYAAAFIAGAGTALWRVAMGPLIMRLAEGAVRARIFSWNVALLVGSGAIWTASAGALPATLERLLAIDALHALRVVLVAGGLLTALAALAVLYVTAPITRVTQRTWSLRHALPEPRLLLTVLAIALWMGAGALVIPFLNLYFTRMHALPVARVGVLFALAQAATALLLLASGVAAARFGARRVLFAWTLLFAPALWALGATSVLPLAIALYFLQGLVPPATNPLIDQVLLEATPAERHGIISSWRNAATELSGFGGAALGGIILERLSFGALFGTAGAVAAIGAALLALALYYLLPARQETRPRNSRNVLSA